MTENTNNQQQELLEQMASAIRKINSRTLAGVVDAMTPEEKGDLLRSLDDKVLLAFTSRVLVDTELAPKAARPTRPPAASRKAARREGPPTSTPLQDSILEALRASPGLLRSDLARRLCLGDMTVGNCVQRLKRKGWIRSERNGRETKWYLSESSTS